MDSVVILQARTSSSRLPAKVMLPIKGFPLVVLAANRASNTGRSVIVVISNEASDDGLAELLKSYGLKYFRGSLEDVLSRIVNALVAYHDDTLVFRLTADNVFPDGALLDEMEAVFLNDGLQYLCCNGESSGLPYGVSAEITRLAHLREASDKNTCALDKEHVTPYIVRKFGATYFRKYSYLKKGHFRSTIDCIEDFTTIQQVFSGVDDPIKESFLLLVNRLENKLYQPISIKLNPPIVLGTAQFGGDYGITNISGLSDVKQCEQLAKTAIANGAIYLDTARAYGKSEEIIGQSLKGGWGGRVKIITKLSPLQDCPKAMTASTINAFVDASVYQSCSALRVQKIDVLMLHRLSHLLDWSGGIWRRLLELQNLGVIGELGASVQNADELSRALDISEIQYIQMPFNLLDWRWEAVMSKIMAVKASRNLTIHVRSGLLQGLLTSVNSYHWTQANVDDSQIIIAWLLNKANECERVNVTDLCLAYVNSFSWVDGITIGVEDINQLRENIIYLNNPKLRQDQINEINRTRPILSEATLNPSLWRSVSR